MMLRDIAAGQCDDRAMNELTARQYSFARYVISQEYFIDELLQTFIFYIFNILCCGKIVRMWLLRIHEAPVPTQICIIWTSLRSTYKM
jgi:hypothetical protein